MTEKTVQATKIFYKNKLSKSKIICNRGGARSSKSFSIAQLFFLDKFFNEKNKKILVLRKTLPSLRLASLLTWKEFISDYKLATRITEEKQFLNYYNNRNNNFLHFGSLDNPEKIKCFHPDTQVFTEEGFKPITEIKIGEKVATMEPFTKKAMFLPVTRLFSYDYSGDMITNKETNKRKNPYICFNVTPNHKMLYYEHEDPVPVMCEAKDLRKNSIFIRTTDNWDGEIPNYIEIPAVSEDKKEETIYDTKILLKILGWFFSKGYLTRDGKTVIIKCGHAHVKQKLLKEFEDIGLKFLIQDKRIVIKSKNLSSFIKDCFVIKFARYKIPQWILKLHPSLLKIFAKPVIEHSFNIASKEFIAEFHEKETVDSLSVLFTKLGYYTRIVRKFSEKYGKLSFYRHYKFTFATSSDKNLTSDIERIKYCGKVYCIEVPPYHTVYTKYKKSCIWCGQSTEWNYIWMQEATDFTYEDFLTLRLRLSARTESERNQLFMCFNPIDEYHWIKTKLIDLTSDVEEIHSTYKDNPFLSDDYIKTIEQNMEIDINYHRVYGLGEWGKLENIIYNNWDVVSDYVTSGEVCYGLDFGFSNPSALIKLVVSGQEVFEEELIYKEGLTNSELIKEVDALGIDKRSPIYADPAEPDRIKEFRDAGYNVLEAHKTGNATRSGVLLGIDFVKRFRCHIYKNSLNLIREKQGYARRKDKQGRVHEDPVPYNNHAMDSERYALYSHFRSRYDSFNLRFV